MFQVLVPFGIQIVLSIEITLGLTIIKINDKPYMTLVLILVETVLAMLNDGILVLLLVSTTVRKNYPVNIVLLMLYTVLTSMMVALPFTSLEIKWQLIAWAVTSLSFVVFTLLGASIRIRLLYTNLWFIIIYTSAFIVIIVAVFVSRYLQIKLMLSVGQATFGRQDVRIAADDYCLAALILYTVLMMDWLIAIQNFQYFTNNTLNETQTNNYRQVSFEVLRSNRMLSLYQKHHSDFTIRLNGYIYIYI
ncbi:unnamed protein product [Schistosoma intercalatum]|nr:unnamed protein product [Schistosoma intercalatum]CAH8522886.1 unnamed protein product [Schistosoma intercalatum]